MMDECGNNYEKSENPLHCLAKAQVTDEIDYENS